MQILVFVLIFVVLNIFYEIFFNNKTISLNAGFFTSQFFISLIIQALIATVSFFLANKLVNKEK